MFKQPMFDQSRWDLIKKNIKSDFGFTDEQFDKQVFLRRMGMRPLPPDSLPVIGPMQMYPNVVLNECYGA